MPEQQDAQPSAPTPTGSRMPILFVCTGNICRSPMAEGMFRHKVVRRGVADRFEIDSAGTGDWQAGNPPDPPARAVAQRHGVKLAGSARAVRPADLEHFRYIVCMDESNREHVLGMGGDPARVGLLLDVDKASPLHEVPDPYNGDEEDFETVYRILDRGCDALLERLLAIECGA